MKDNKIIITTSQLKRLVEKSKVTKKDDSLSETDIKKLINDLLIWSQNITYAAKNMKIHGATSKFIGDAEEALVQARKALAILKTNS